MQYHVVPFHVSTVVDTLCLVFLFFFIDSVVYFVFVLFKVVYKFIFAFTSVFFNYHKLNVFTVIFTKKSTVLCFATVF